MPAMSEDRETQEAQQAQQSQETQGSPAPQTPTPRAPQEARAPHPLDERLAELWRVLRRESILWPVLVAVALAGVTLGAALLALALYLAQPAALLALAILLVASLDLARREIRRRGVGPLTGMLAAYWLLTGAALPLARALGLL